MKKLLTLLILPMLLSFSSFSSLAVEINRKLFTSGINTECENSRDLTLNVILKTTRCNHTNGSQSLKLILEHHTINKPNDIRAAIVEIGDQVIYTVLSPDQNNVIYKYEKSFELKDLFLKIYYINKNMFNETDFSYSDITLFNKNPVEKVIDPDYNPNFEKVNGNICIVYSIKSNSFNVLKKECTHTDGTFSQKYEIFPKVNSDNFNVFGLTLKKDGKKRYIPLKIENVNHIFQEERVEKLTEISVTPAYSAPSGFLSTGKDEMGNHKVHATIEDITISLQ